MKTYFITFGAGGQNYYEAIERLGQQANKVNVFNDIKLYTDEDLKQDTEFWSKHSTFIENNKRGYGYWIWKPYIIKKTLEQMEDGDVLLYLDCGCEIDYRKQNIFNYYFELVKTECIIGTHICNDREWTKMDLILQLDMLNDDYLNSEQHQTGALLFLACDKTRFIANEWYKLGNSDYHNIDDTPSINKNIDCFIEHRHDQSTFSLLTKKYNIYSNHSMYGCIEYLRNRCGISKLQI